jgi:phosphoribosylaminoimidazole-succinocarboxamide synthase
MKNVLLQTNFNFPGQKSVYKGKVRDVYNINDQQLVMIVTDRISAFDVILSRGIPYKGQVLNQIAARFFDATSNLVSNRKIATSDPNEMIVPNWKIATPDPNVMIGHKCEPYPVEMIVRAYLTGSSWRAYKDGKREICGIKIPDGMKEHQRFDEPIITPTTKAEHGKHDEDISREEIIRSGLVPEDEYALIEKYTMEIFRKGSEIAAKRGLIFVDTKYEFGKKDGKIYLIDEANTPDSSRYFYANEYQEQFDKGLPQKQLSKEFVREWLMVKGFQGKSGQSEPEMPDEFVDEVSLRYIELYEQILGEKFVKPDETQDVSERIFNNVLNFMAQ